MAEEFANFDDLDAMINDVAEGELDSLIAAYEKSLRAISKSDLEYLLNQYRCLVVRKADTQPPGADQTPEKIITANADEPYHWPIHQYVNQFSTAPGADRYGPREEVNLAGTIAQQGWNTAHKIAALIAKMPDESEDNGGSNGSGTGWPKIYIEGISNPQMIFALWCAAQEHGIELVNFAPSFDQEDMYYRIKRLQDERKAELRKKQVPGPA